ncbi:hypothetical protein [Beijerinckia mobilis]|uniref:hypothetical protein n=1 Tax=Beijerinckia mobilis TaxID=231434 RepID=UPI00068F3C56|nr:hypothetical protein [Beijerinckia mobilis]
MYAKTNPAFSPAADDFPKRLNLGSGKDFRPDFLNIDIDGRWTPDAVVDLCTQEIGQQGLVLTTERFGRIRLMPCTLTSIIAMDVLEHVAHLPMLMRNCLTLLEFGGLFEIQVPYDLSFGAWQDPTHIRAFNERSWLYYTDWFWYLGWNDARFTLDALTFVPSPFGATLIAEGKNLEEISRTPRAIDAMKVVLRKIPLTAQESGMVETIRPAQRDFGSTLSPMPAGASISPPFAEGFEYHRHRHCIWVVTPENYPHSHAFDEITEALSAAFEELGGSAPIVRHQWECGDRVPIVFGAHLLPEDISATLPRDSIIVNLEQIDDKSSWTSESYCALLSRHPVLDYSRDNIHKLNALGMDHIRLLKLGYTSRLERIHAVAEQDIDILFYGSLNERRRLVLQALEDRGLTVVHLFGVYGQDRDALIARAKIVLNLHFYDAKIFEIVRVFYLLTNRICIVSEGSTDDPDVQDFADGLALCRYEDLVETCVTLANDPEKRHSLATNGYRHIHAHPQSACLAQLF